MVRLIKPLNVAPLFTTIMSVENLLDTLQSISCHFLVLEFSEGSNPNHDMDWVAWALGTDGECDVMCAASRELRQEEV